MTDPILADGCAPVRSSLGAAGRVAGAELLFQVITEREERASVACASNAPFSERDQTLTDPRLAPPRSWTG